MLRRFFVEQVGFCYSCPVEYLVVCLDAGAGRTIFVVGEFILESTIHTDNYLDNLYLYTTLLEPFSVEGKACIVSSDSLFLTLAGSVDFHLVSGKDAFRRSNYEPTRYSGMRSLKS